MNGKDLIRALRGMAVETGSLVCFGCGHEHGCSVNGCAIINEASARLEGITEPSNDPLALDELREMDGEPVYMLDLTDGELWSQWIIFQKHSDDGFIPKGGGWFSAENYGKTWLAYRRKPEEA